MRGVISIGPIIEILVQKSRLINGNTQDKFAIKLDIVHRVDTAMKVEKM